MASVDMHDIDLKEFNEVLAACKGDVFMVTPEGDRLNLKSRLCQLIGFTKLIEGGSIAEAKLECSDPEDQRRLFRFNMFGEKLTVSPFGAPASAGAFLCPNARMRTVFAASPFVCTKLDGLV